MLFSSLGTAVRCWERLASGIRSLPRLKRAAIVAACAALVVSAGCGMDSRRAAAHALHQELETVVGRLERNPTRTDGCADVGSVRGKLYAEHGPADLPDVWVPLRSATDALLAACGQLELLQLPAQEPGAPVVVAARERWQAGVTQQVRAACGWLGDSAAILGRPAPACTR